MSHEIPGASLVTCGYVRLRRSQSWHEHEDAIFETITEQRIRRNFMQGG